MSGPRSCPPATYALYANDIMVFCKGTKKNLAVLMTLFQNYGSFSGLHLSMEKCRFFIGSMSLSRQMEIKQFLGFKAGNLPFTYLGVPIFKDKPKTVHL